MASLFEELNPNKPAQEPGGEDKKPKEETPAVQSLEEITITPDFMQESLTIVPDDVDPTEYPDLVQDPDDPDADLDYSTGVETTPTPSPNPTFDPEAFKNEIAQSVKDTVKEAIKANQPDQDELDLKAAKSNFDKVVAELDKMADAEDKGQKVNQVRLTQLMDLKNQFKSEGMELEAKIAKKKESPTDTKPSDPTKVLPQAAQNMIAKEGYWAKDPAYKPWKNMLWGTLSQMEVEGADMNDPKTYTEAMKTLRAAGFKRPAKSGVSKSPIPTASPPTTPPKADKDAKLKPWQNELIKLQRPEVQEIMKKRFQNKNRSN